MALGWTAVSREQAMAELITQKKYGKAIEILRAQLQAGGRDARARLQLADILVAAGRTKEAAPLYLSLADEYARDGFVAKAVAVLKKVQKVAPGQADVERRLAQLVKEKQRTSTITIAPPQVEFGMEEIGIEPHPMPIASAAPPTPAPTPTPTPSAAAPAAAKKETDFEEEFFATIQEAFSAPSEPTLDAAGRPVEPPPRVRSPLFDEFTEDELAAVIEKLNLLTFESGDIVISEGEPGDSLFVLTTGAVKAFVRNPSGRQVCVRQMTEGAFFGEISILSGKPRTATITCATPCELLELDRAALDTITATRPRVQQVLFDFYRQRHGSEAEQLVRGMAFGASGRDAAR
jgi:hypothetical protein